MGLKILGAVLAGGRSSRFGSDKAAALFRGRPLIEHVIDGLQMQCHSLVVCGRNFVGAQSLEDRPRRGLGPLGGLAAALHHAGENAFDGVLTSACDTPLVPQDLAQQLVGPEAAIAVGQPIFGYWPAALSNKLDDFHIHSQTLAMRDWAICVGARRVRLDSEVPNINTPGDLSALQELEQLGA